MHGMNKTINLRLLTALLALITLADCTSQSARQEQAGAIRKDPVIKITTIAGGFTGPVAMDCPKDGSGRLFICEQTGKIKIIKDGKVMKQVFLDLGEKIDNVNRVYSEKGLLGLAFHPRYKSNGKFYVFYSAPVSDKKYDHKSVLSEYTVSANSDMADAKSERVILEILQPESNHNGGQLAFGPEGFLYIGSGDGGGAGDEHGEKGNGQDLSTLLGKILRIDVNANAPYAIPPDNPFVGKEKIKPEIFAYGLRNPWRFSFDRKTGQLFCADVGQEKWEEIDIIQKGKNYGWRIMEGNHCYNPETNCDTRNLVPPVAEYGHADGISVTGGYVYRGKKSPLLTGKYFFGDWKGKMYYMEEADGKWNIQKLMIDGRKDNDLGKDINSFGEDEQGEIYVLVQNNQGNFMANGSVCLLEIK